MIFTKGDKVSIFDVTGEVWAGSGSPRQNGPRGLEGWADPADWPAPGMNQFALIGTWVSTAAPWSRTPFFIGTGNGYYHASDRPVVAGTRRIVAIDTHTVEVLRAPSRQERHRTRRDNTGKPDLPSGAVFTRPDCARRRPGYFTQRHHGPHLPFEWLSKDNASLQSTPTDEEPLTWASASITASIRTFNVNGSRVSTSAGCGRSTAHRTCTAGRLRSTASAPEAASPSPMM